VAGKKAENPGWRLLEGCIFMSGIKGVFLVMLFVKIHSPLIIVG